MKNKVVIILLLTIGLLFIYKKKFIYKNILTINSFQEAMPYLINCNENMLILFDVDDTLIRGYDIGMANGRDIPLLFKILAPLKHPSIIKRSVWDYYYSIMWKRAKRFIIEPEVVQIIQDLKKKDCTVLALTLMNSGSYGIIKNFPEFRYENLEEFGIEFSQKFPDTIFTKLPKYKDNYPLLYKGILFANLQSKGAVLGAFIDNFDLRFEKIIYFDDHLDYLKSVAKECKKRNIEFLGFYYQAKKGLQGSFSVRRALIELDYLIEHEQWLTNEASEMVMYERTNNF